MTANYHTPIALRAVANANVLNFPYVQMDSFLSDLHIGTEGLVQQNFGTATELTIANGIITITRSYHTVDTEGDASSDDLTTIQGGNTGDSLVLRASHTDRTVIVKHGAVNIYINTNADVILDNANKSLELFCHDGVWSNVSFFSPEPQSVLVPRTQLSQDGFISISNISAAYSTLELLLEVRGAGSNPILNLQLNNDVTSNYHNSLRANLTTDTITSVESMLTSNLEMAFISNSADIPNSYSPLRILFPGYVGTQAHSVVAMGYAYRAHAFLEQLWGGGFWTKGETIHTILLGMGGFSQNIDAGSAYTLFGYK